MNHKFLFSIAATILLLGIDAAPAQVIVTYNFEGDPVTAAMKTGTDAALVNASPFDPAGPNTAISANTDTAFISTLNTPKSLSAALSGPNYFGFTLSIADGMSTDTMDLTSLSIAYGGNSTSLNSYTTNMVAQSSVGGFGSAAPTLTVTPSSFLVSGSSRTFTTATVDISDIAFDSLSTVEFRFYFYDNDLSGNSSPANRINFVTLGATVVPEPSTALLMCVGALCGLVRLRRRALAAQARIWVEIE